MWQLRFSSSEKGRPFPLHGLLITFQLCLENLVLPEFFNLKTYCSCLET